MELSLHKETHVIFIINLAVYCYTCDDDVKDNSLIEHLGIYGIKTDSMIKTEKTISELVFNNLNQES